MFYFIKKIHRITFLITIVLNNLATISQTSFRPSDIPGLKLWLRSDTGIALSGNLVNYWNDISGNNNNAFQTINSIMPTWIVSDTLLNNYPAVKFDGAGSMMQTMFGQPDAYTIFIIYSHRSGVNGSFYSTNQSGYPLQRNSTIWPNSNVAPYNIGGGDLLNIRNLYVDVHDFLNDSYATYLNGINRGGFNVPISKSGGVFNIGSGGGEPLDANIAEFLIYDQPLLDSSRIKVENYLMGRYAPPVSLGADKIVCSLPITLKAKKNHFTNYLWQNGSTADSIVVTTQGDYYVKTQDIFGKVSFDTINVTLDNSTWVVSLPNDTTICLGKSIKITAGPDHLSYYWSHGSTSNLITANLSGLYKVLVTDCFGNLSSDSIQINIQPLPSFNFGGNDTIICHNSNFVLDPDFLNSIPFNFYWNDNTHDSIHPISQNGLYILNVVDNIGCSFSDTINIQIDTLLKTASLGPDVSLCAGNSISLINGASSASSYTWNTGSNNDSLLITNAGQYSVIVTNTNNCIAKDTINVSIQGQAPVANFSSSVGCQNKALSFTNLSSPPSGNIINSSYWDFGDIASPTNTSTASNPFHTYSDTGTYTVRLNVMTDAGCQQAITKTIHIAPNPTVNFSIGNSCQNDSTAFSNQSTSLNGYPNTSINWNFGDPASGSSNISTKVNPKHLFSSASNYTITLSVSNAASCTASLTNIISVKPQVKADFNYSTPCTNTTTVFQDNSIASSSAANTRSWNFGGPLASGLTVSRTYTATGPYNVSLTVNVNGCISTKTKIVTIFSPPISNFTVPTICAKDTVTLVNSSLAQSGILSSFNWKLNGNTFSSVSNPTLALMAPGNYPVKLTVTNSYGCTDSISKSLLVNSLPNAAFTTNPPDYYYLNEPVQFIPVVTNAASYNWSLGNGSTSTLQSPSISFNSENSFTVSLTLSDAQGCQNSLTKTIFISKRFLDLALLNISSIKDDDGFITVVADIANYGTVKASQMELQYQISDGGTNKENWSGVLNPNAFFTYTFNSKSVSDQTNANPITCVTIKKVNGGMDERLDNNELCSALIYDEISVLNPFPNPTYENLNIPVILNKDAEISLTIYNSTGQLIQEKTGQKGTAGLTFISIPTITYSWGTYLIKITIDDKVFIKKFVKAN